MPNNVSSPAIRNYELVKHIIGVIVMDYFCVFARVLSGELLLLLLTEYVRSTVTALPRPKNDCGVRACEHAGKGKKGKKGKRSRLSRQWEKGCHRK